MIEKNDNIIGRVHKIIKFSAVDGPGNRSVIFLQGCNFNCGYCHNPETIDVNSSDILYMTSKDIFNEIGNALKFIRGITASGGEATLQKDFLLELFKLAKEKGLSTFIDSNGSIDFSKNDNLLSVTDSVMLDIKTMNDYEHKILMGHSNEMTIKNLHFLAGEEKLFEIRTVISPNMFDCEDTVFKASKIIGEFKNIRYKLIKYRLIGVRKEFLLKKYKVPSNDFMKKLEQIAIDNGVSDIVTI